MSATDFRPTPYFGLDYYDEKWGAWFFGRERERAKVITNLRAARLTILHADSGVGKSSLLRAGVVARLRELTQDNQSRPGAPRYLPIVFSAWKDDPVPDLLTAVEQALQSAGIARHLPREHLLDGLKAAAEAFGGKLLIILDQFEEYYIYRARENPPERFADELAASVKVEGLAANFLIAVREDAYAGLGELFRGRLPNIYANYLNVDYLGTREAEAAIRKPVTVYNEQPGVAPVTIDDELVKAVIKQVSTGTIGNGGDGAVATPLLQLVMESVWEREQKTWSEQANGGARMLHRQTLDDLEGVEHIVDTHLDKALRSLPEDQRAIAVALFTSLVTASGGKIAESVPDLANRIDRSEADVGAVLEHLDAARIVRPVPAAPNRDPIRYRRYEIFHDVLAPAINRVIDADREARVQREREAAAARVRVERQRARRFRALAIAAGVAFVVAGAAFVIALIEQHAAVSDRHTAQSIQLAASAGASADPELGTLLALKALSIKTTPQADLAVRDSLAADQTITTLHVGTAMNAAAFDPVNMTRIAGAGEDGVARIWDARSGRLLLRLTPVSGFRRNGAALSLAFDPSGRQVAVGYGLGTIAVFDARTGHEIDSAAGYVGASLASAPAAVHAVAWMGHTGDLALATDFGAGVWRRQLHHRCCLWFEGDQDQATAYDVASDPAQPTRLVIADMTGTAIWDLSRPGHPQPHQLTSETDTSAAFSPDGTTVAIGSADGAVSVVDAATGQVRKRIGDRGNNVDGVAFSPNGRSLVAGYSDGSAPVWNLRTRLTMTMLAADTGAVHTARFSPDSREIVTASSDGDVRVAYALPRELRAELYPSRTPLPDWAAQFDPAAQRILTFDDNGVAYLLRRSGARQAVLDPGANVNVYSARFNPTGTEVVTADTDGTVKLWDAGPNVSGTPGSRATITIPNTAPTYAAFDRTGSRIVVVIANTAEVFGVNSRRRLLPILNPRHGTNLVMATFNPAAAQIATADDNGQVELWDASSGHLTMTLGRPGDPSVSDAEFDQAGDRLVTVTESNAITIWSSRTGRPDVTIPDACPAPNAASFDASGTMIAVACSDGSTRIFDAGTGQQLTLVRPISSDTITSASFSADGRSLLTSFHGAGSTGGVRVWSTELAVRSLSRVQAIARSRARRALTAGERSTYLAGIGS